MTIIAREIPCKSTNEIRLASVDFQDKLDSGELLTGTPTAAEVTTSDLTLDTVAVNTAALTVNGRSVAIGQGVQFRIQSGTAGTTYTILLTATTDSNPAQTFKELVRIRVVAES